MYAFQEILSDGELDEEATVKKFLTVQTEGGLKSPELYSFDRWEMK